MTLTQLRWLGAIGALMVLVALVSIIWNWWPKSSPPPKNVPSASESSSLGIVRLPSDAPSPAAKPVAEDPIWRAIAPPKGSQSAGVTTENKGRVWCYHSDRYALMHVTVHHSDGRNEHWAPIPIGPGRRPNLGTLPEKSRATLAFESEDSEPTKVAVNRDCLPSF